MERRFVLFFSIWPNSFMAKLLQSTESNESINLLSAVMTKFSKPKYPTYQNTQYLALLLKNSVNIKQIMSKRDNLCNKVYLPILKCTIRLVLINNYS